LQMGPATLASLTASAQGPASTGARNATGSAAGVTEQRTPPSLAPSDPILENPNEAWRTEVIQALIDAMLDYSSPLRIGMDEWLTIAARRNEERPRLAPADSGAQSVVIRARGSDLAAFRGGQISREEVVKRVDRRVF